MQERVPKKEKRGRPPQGEGEHAGDRHQGYEAGPCGGQGGAAAANDHESQGGGATTATEDKPSQDGGLRGWSSQIEDPGGNWSR